MPAKHNGGFATSGFFGFSVARSRLAAGAGAIAALVVGSAVWALTSSPDDQNTPSLIVIPTAALSAPPQIISTDSSFGISASPSAPPVDPSASTPSPSATPAPGGPAAEPTRSPDGAPRPTTTSATPPSSADLAATYALDTSWNDGFVANTFITNNTGSPKSWQIRLTYPSNVQIAVTGFWNATASVSGSTLVLDGGPLPPEEKVQAGFQATKNKEQQVNPSACTVNGATCGGF